MPTVQISCNVELSNDAVQALLKTVSASLANVLGKPESFMMVMYDAKPLIFGGTADPSAFVSLASLGAVGPNNNEIVKVLSGLLEEHTGTPANRVYVQITDVPRADFGWSGKTFG